MVRICKLMRVLLPVFSLGSVAGVALAGLSPPTAYPVWSMVFPRSELAFDTVAPFSGPSWAELRGGDTVVVTSIGDGVLLRRFAADGSVRTEQRALVSDVDGSGSVAAIVAKPLASGDGIYVLAGSYQSDCKLMRFSGDLRLEWATSIPSAPLVHGVCRDMEVLADDSVLALRASGLARIRSDGEVSWSVVNGDGGRYFEAAGFALDLNGIIWVASRGGVVGSAAGSNQASVLRYHMDGALLSADDFLCGTCVASLSMSIDVLPNGNVIVGGASGSGQPGFFARYSPDGQRLLFVDTENDVHYAHLAHDGAGFIYAQTEGPFGQVRRIDEQTGTVLWAVAADDSTTLDAGVATIHAVAGAIEVIALDASGLQRWTRIVAAAPAASVSRGLSRNGHLEILARDGALTSPNCGTSPRLITLDDFGAVIDQLHACTMQGWSAPYSIDAKAGIGVLANLRHRLVAYSPDGDVRWQIPLCEWCDGATTGEPGWLAARSTDDGGAWAAARTPSSLRAEADVVVVKRIGPDGKIEASLPTAALATDDPALRLLGGAHDTIVLQPSTPQGLTWQKVDDQSAGLGPFHYPMPDFFFAIDDARRLVDGSVILAASSPSICSVGCSPRNPTLMRIEADGTLSWRYQFPEDDAMVALSRDGGAVATFSRPEDGQPTWRRIAADGSVGASTPIDGVPPFVELSQLVGGIDGRWLLQTEGGWPYESALWLIDDSGHVVNSRRNTTYASILATGASGYLTDDFGGAAAKMPVLDPYTLVVEAFVAFTTAGTPYEDFRYTWSMADDGSVYGVTQTHRDGFGVTKLARFSLPGAVPSNLVFRDSFD